MTIPAKTRGWAHAVKGVVMRVMPMMMSCQEFEQAVQDGMDVSLTPYQRWKLELHRRLCRECRDYVNAYRASIATLKKLYSTPEPPAAVPPPDLVKRLLDSRKG